MDLTEQVTRAVAALHADTGFEGGAEVRSARVLEALGIEAVPKREPGEADARYIKRVEKHRMRSLGPVEALRERLLKDHKVDIQATGRGAYRIVPSAVQSAKAEKDGRRQAIRALRKSSERILHTNVDRLDSEARMAREAAMLNTASRISMLTGKSASRVLADVRASAEAEVSPVAKVPQPSLRR